MLFNRLIALVTFVFVCTVVTAQYAEPDIKFGNVKPSDFKPKYYDVDSFADAVVLYEIGSSVHGDKYYGISTIIYKVFKRIRLLHKNSFDNLATIRIALYGHGSGGESLDDWHASTYNIENGNVVATKLDKSSIFKEKEGDNQVLKFTFPNLKEGCIIEYAYTLIIPNFTSIPKWSFQSEYPKLWSEFTVEIPSNFDFVVLTKGYLEPTIDSLKSTTNYSGTVNKHIWAYRNVPAIKEENYITSLSNYTQSIEFQLSAVNYLYMPTKYFLHTWQQTVEQLMDFEGFGQDLKKENGWLKDDVKAAVAGESDLTIKAKKIYEYVRDNYNCINNSAMGLSQSIKKTEQSKKGNVADINMLLIAMLKVAGFDADPVLLSTREHGKTVDVYPILDKFNYVIAHVTIDDNTSYLLDAANPLLSFGHLDENCYNGNARLIASEPVLINLSADSLRETEVTTLFLSNDPDGKISGTYRHVFGEMQSNDLREKMKKTNSEKYFNDVKKSFSFETNLINTTIDSLKQLEMPVAVQYDISIKPEEDIIYFTPVLGDGAYKENPFKAAQRLYPVEMPYCTDETYIFNMEVPSGYKIDELPKPGRVTLNENEGSFEYLIQSDGNHIQLQCRLKLNKATFEPDDYQTLRDFFAYVVEKENEQIVFKKQ